MRRLRTAWRDGRRWSAARRRPRDGARARCAGRRCRGAVRGVTLTVRRVTASDAEMLWEWRNDALVRQNSFTSEPIGWTDHQCWLADRLASKDTVIYVLEDGVGPVAQVRYERRG